MASSDTYRIRIHAIRTTNLDGSQPATVTPEEIEAMVAGANTIFQAANVQFVFNKATDFEERNNHFLNHDVTLQHPSTWQDSPETPPLKIADIDQNNTAVHDAERASLAALYPGELVIFFRYGEEVAYNKGTSKWEVVSTGGSFAGPHNYITMAGVGSGTGKTLAHEIGHFFSLGHTHREDPYLKSVAELQQRILDVFVSNPPDHDTVVNFFDSDAPAVKDTPADPGQHVWEDAFSRPEFDCNFPGTFTVDVDFPSGTKQYTFSPDLGNVMSYFKHCPWPMTLSNDQIKIVRKQLEEGPRKYLITPRWARLGGKVKGTPTVVTWGKDRLDVFVRGTDDALYRKAWDGDHWWPSDQPDDWEKLGGKMKNMPSVVTWGKDRLDMFVVGTDDGIWHKAWDGTQWWPSHDPDDWEKLGGKVKGTPTVVTWGKDRLDVFVRGTDDALYRKAWDGDHWWPSDQPDDWEKLGGKMKSVPTVVTWGKDRLDMFVVGTDDGIWHKAWDGTHWWPSDQPDDWEKLGGKVKSTPTVVTWGKDRLDVFVRGTDDALYRKAWDGDHWWPSDQPDDWEKLGGKMKSVPTVVTWGKDRLDMFVVGTDDGIWHKAWDGTQWWPSNEPDDWEKLGGEVKGAPTVVTWGKDRLDVFTVGIDDSIWHRAWSQDRWFPIP